MLPADLSRRLDRDLKDIEHDQRVLKDGLPEDTRFVCPERPCPDTSMCRWVGNECKTCGKRRGFDADVAQVLELAAVLRAGATLPIEQLSSAQWRAIGSIRARGEL